MIQQHMAPCVNLCDRSLQQICYTLIHFYDNEEILNFDPKYFVISFVYICFKSDQFICCTDRFLRYIIFIFFLI